MAKKFFFLNLIDGYSRPSVQDIELSKSNLLQRIYVILIPVQSSGPCRALSTHDTHRKTAILEPPREL